MNSMDAREPVILILEDPDTINCSIPDTPIADCGV
jgi:hypothetical protein